MKTRKKKMVTTVFFNPLGEEDSLGSYSNGLKNGTWFYYTADDIVQKEFVMGSIISVKHTEKGNPTKKNYDPDIIARHFSDSLKKIKDPLTVVTPLPDSFHIESESYFPGGGSGWVHYMLNNLTYPVIDQKNRIQGTVIVKFIVDTDGKIYDPKISKSVEYFLDEASLQLIRKSPPWMPATKHDEKVKSYKKQPITFKLTN